MAEVTPIRSPEPPRVEQERAFSKLLDDLLAIQSTIACASVALGQAQDNAESELGAKAWMVINRCAGELDRLHSAFDSWKVAQARC